MRIRPLALLAVLLAGAAAAQTPRYAEVRIPVAALPALGAAGVAVDHAHRDGDAVVAVLNAWELGQVNSLGLDVEVLTPDLGATPRPDLGAPARDAIERAAPVQGFDFGSMGGYYTLDELGAELDSMHAAYPELTTEKVSIGQTGEGRDIWMVKISDQPEVDSADPEVLYTALHHAREPQSMATVVYFMYYLLENYGTDPEVTALVREREFTFVPVVNPDGYAYNEEISPNGGGLWRKNRRPNLDASIGVDLNRNYGFNWGLNNQGSSGTPSSQTYRGTEAFSEPEIAALRDLALERQFAIAFHYHSRGEEYLFPWGYDVATYTPDDDRFRALSAEMSAENGYEWGTGADVLYPVNGDATDWFYGEQTLKPKALSWTAEVCNRTTDGFWPPQDRIFPIAQENILANLVLARAAGPPPTAGEAGPATTAGLRVSPNPTAGRIRLEGAAAPVTVTDLLGRRLLSLPAGAGALDLSVFGPGIYVVRSGGEARRVVVTR